MEKVKLNLDRVHQTYKTRDGKKVVGVTTALNKLDKPALLAWAWQCGVDGIDYRKVRDNAATVGTVAHWLCECHVKGLTPDTSDIARPTLDAAESSFLKFLEFWDGGKFKLVASEIQLVHDVLEFGGTLDIVARDAQDRLCLVDLKSSKAIYDEMSFQLAAYEVLWNDAETMMVDGAPFVRIEVGRVIERKLIVRIGKTEAADLEIRELGNLGKHYRVFLAALEVYKAQAALKT